MNPFMTAATHPTPALTFIASVGQFSWQAPHSIHASRSIIFAFLFLMVKTVWGHTSAHRLHPIHLSISSSKVATFFRYRSLVILFCPK